MISYVVLKFIGDLASFYALFGCVLGAAGFGAGSGLLCLLIQCACVLASYLLREKKNLSRLCILLLAGGYFLPLSVCNIVLYSMANVYVVISIWKQLFFPDWESRAKILKLTAGLSVALVALICAFKAGAYVRAIFAPFAVLSLASNAIITRSLRHDPGVYLSARYQAVNMAGLGAALLASFVLSSDLFLRFVKRTAQILYGKVIIKVLIFIINIFVKLVRLLAKAFSFLSGLFSGSAKTEIAEANLDMSDIMESLGAEEVGEGSAVFDYIIYGFLIIVGLVLAYKLLKAMLGNKKMPAGSFSAQINRKAAAPGAQTSFEEENTNAEKVRKSYKQFLKHYARLELPLKKSSTSFDVNRFSRGVFGAEKPQALRKLYLSARYKNEATKEDASAAKALAKELCKMERE